MRSGVQIYNNDTFLVFTTRAISIANGKRTGGFFFRRTDVRYRRLAFYGITAFRRSAVRHEAFFEICVPVPSPVVRFPVIGAPKTDFSPLPKARRNICVGTTAIRVFIARYPGICAHDEKQQRHCAGLPAGDAPVAPCSTSGLRTRRAIFNTLGYSRDRPVHRTRVKPIKNLTE